MLPVTALLCGLVGAPPVPVLHLVIDDVGLQADAMDAFFEIDGLVEGSTWALLPTAEFARPLARRIVRAGGTLFIHVPMEPEDRSQMTRSLGGYLETRQTDGRIKNLLSHALVTLPASLRKKIKGINNHQGSRFTADRRAMNAVMEVLARRRLCFLDSRTTASSAGVAAAQAAKVPVFERNVFLDNTRSTAAIRKQLDAALDAARKGGSAIAIGHPYPETAAALTEWLRQHAGRVQLGPLCVEPEPVQRKKRRSFNPKRG